MEREGTAVIPFNFEYYAPETLGEAHSCYMQLAEAGKNPVWYAGGTELISMARVGSRAFGAVVDLKEIPECRCAAVEQGQVVLGAALTLTQVDQSGLFPLLGRTVARIADHTIQDKLTLGGNLAGTIQYREAALPLLLCDCTARVMTERGPEERPFAEVFDGWLTLGNGEFLIGVLIPEQKAALPHCHAKRTKQDKIDYPLVTLCAVRDGETIKAAVSGYGNAPLLLPGDVLNNIGLNASGRSARACERVMVQGTDGLQGKLDYKTFVLKDMILQALNELGVL